MIIDQLPSITLPVEDTDEMPIERGQYTYKVSLSDLLSGASADITVIAAEYDPTASYAVGDYCTHEGLFYICITPVTAEAWDVTKWDEVTVGEELQKAGGVYVGTTEPTDENIKIWLDTDEPGMSAVSSVNGATGTVVLDADDVGAMSDWVLLWTNASPTSSFSDQTISLDLSEYEFVVVNLIENIASQSRRITFLAKIGNEVTFATILSATSTIALARRVTTISSSSIDFGVGQYQAAGASMSTANERLVPYQIYGVKGVTA